MALNWRSKPKTHRAKRFQVIIEIYLYTESICLVKSEYRSQPANSIRERTLVDLYTNNI